MKYCRGAAGRIACGLHFCECSGNAGSQCDLSSSDWDVLNRGSTTSCFQFQTPVRSLHVVFPAEQPLHKVLLPGSRGGRRVDNSLPSTKDPLREPNFALSFTPPAIFKSACSFFTRLSCFAPPPSRRLLGHHHHQCLDLMGGINRQTPLDQKISPIQSWAPEAFWQDLVSHHLL